MKKIAAFIASGTGMGAEAAKHLHSKGYNIAIMSSSGKGEKLANQLGGLGFTGSNLISKDINYFIEKVYKNFGKRQKIYFCQDLKTENYIQKLIKLIFYVKQKIFMHQKVLMKR